MMKKWILALTAMLVTLMSPLSLRAEEKADSAAQNELNPKEIIFEHLGDGYGWEVPFNHHKRIPLPVILIGKDGVHCFMSSKVEHGEVYNDGGALFKIAGEDSNYKVSL